MGNLEAKHVEFGSGELEEVFRLYRANSRQLGFLPRGAFEEFARLGTLVTATDADRLAGYLAYRVAGSEAVLVHLCVREDFRCKGVASALMTQLFADTGHLRAVRLSCREEYAANKMWPRFGFTCLGEHPGRGRDGGRLFCWTRSHESQLPLLEHIQTRAREGRRTAVVDANVFYDFYESVQRAAESQSVLADWLEPEVLICVTVEMRNEIARQQDTSRREDLRRRLTAFQMLEADVVAFGATCEALDPLLPPIRSQSDESDRRQLGHAIAKQAHFFITRDTVLLDHSDILRERFGIEVLRPSDFVLQLHADVAPNAYQPVRLAGTTIKERPPRSESELLPFQRFAASEPKADWLKLCRKLLTDPDRFRLHLVEPPDTPPRVFYALDSTNPDALEIVALRTLSHSLTPTLLRRIISDVVRQAFAEKKRWVACDDAGDPVTEESLEELGFRRTGSGFKKMIVHGVVTKSQALEVSPPFRPCESVFTIMERQLWPLKVMDAEIPSFIVPIRPYWAAQLFDAELARWDLFGADHRLALALENIYYSASAITIPPGSRILWYVSKSGRQAVKEVRACSLCVETVREPAHQLFRRFNRLGVYKWADIVRVTRGDPSSELSAYRFAFTETFATPISWGSIQQILAQRTGKANPLAGPVKVPPQVFFDIYTTGME